MASASFGSASASVRVRAMAWVSRGVEPRSSSRLGGPGRGAAGGAEPLRGGGGVGMAGFTGLSRRGVVLVIGGAPRRGPGGGGIAAAATHCSSSITAPQARGSGRGGAGTGGRAVAACHRRLSGVSGLGRWRPSSSAVVLMIFITGAVGAGGGTRPRSCRGGGAPCGGGWRGHGGSSVVPGAGGLGGWGSSRDSWGLHQPHSQPALALRALRALSAVGPGHVRRWHRGRRAGSAA